MLQTAPASHIHPVVDGWQQLALHSFCQHWTICAVKGRKKIDLRIPKLRIKNSLLVLVVMPWLQEYCVNHNQTQRNFATKYKCIEKPLPCAITMFFRTFSLSLVLNTNSCRGCYSDCGQPSLLWIPLLFSLLFSPELVSFVLPWKLQVFLFSPWQVLDVPAQKKSPSHLNFRRWWTVPQWPASESKKLVLYWSTQKHWRVLSLCI